MSPRPSARRSVVESPRRLVASLAIRRRTQAFACLVVCLGLGAVTGTADEDPGGDEKAPASAAGKHPANRLAEEKSPYLQQHAHNPVDWYPWGEEAFKKARDEGKPIFLSIGYSTCHWCHVMERESFENEAIAKYLNEHFVSIKVDREERPDVDGVYMAAVQALTRHGGWPLSAFLTQDGKPFFGGTYFPPDTFQSLLENVVKVWKTQRATLDEQADNLTRFLASQSGSSSERGVLEPSVTQPLFEYLQKAHDEEHGGFAGPPRHAPKFPRTSNLDFLLRYARRTGEPAALAMVENTLDHLIDGGIHDHLGGGFHRYSVDRIWLVPHFEKMLYDNALIPRTLLDAYRVLGKPRYLEVAVATLDYVLGRLGSPEGAFWSAEDADTDGVEGLTYVWSLEEVRRVLGAERSKLFETAYGVTAAGNFEEGGHRGNVLMLQMPLEKLAEQTGRPLAQVRESLAASRRDLLRVREARPQPFLDRKVLAEWNGLAISALAQGYQVSGEARFLTAAQRAAAFVVDKMMQENGRILRRFRDGAIGIDGFLEDYAFVIEGLLDLYETDGDRRWLEASTRLADVLLASFQDSEEGGFYGSATHSEKLIFRQKNYYDGAVPSGASIALLDLLRLAELTTDKRFREPAELFLAQAAGFVRSQPHSHPQFACALEFFLSNPLEIVIVGPRESAETRALREEVWRRFLPGKVLVHTESKEAASSLASLVPLAESKLAIAGKPTAYVCRQQVCKLPAKTLAQLREQLDSAPTGSAAAVEGSRGARQEGDGSEVPAEPKSDTGESG